MESTPGRKSFYGWWIVALLFCTLISTGGNGFYGFAVYVPRLMTDLGCSTAQLMLAAAVWAVVFGFSNPVIGVLMHRYGVKKIFVSGIVAAGLLMFLLSFITRLWQLYALNLLAGFAGAATILVPSQTLITTWFDRRRGIAMAIAMMGIGVGGFVIPQFAAWLIHKYGWRESFQIAAALNYLIVLPPILIFLKDRPSDVGQYVDGIRSPHETDAAPEKIGMTAGRAVRTPTFWLLMGVFILQLFVMSGLQMNVQNFAEEQMGYSLMIATRFMAFALLVTLPARFIVGWLCDRIHPKYLIVATGLFLTIGPFILWFFVIHLNWTNDYRAIALFSFFQGFGIAGSAIALPILVGRCFGEREFSKIMGLIMAGFAIGVIFGPFSMGKIFDMTGSYAHAFFLAMAVALLSGFLALFIRTDPIPLGISEASAPAVGDSAAT